MSYKIIKKKILNIDRAIYRQLYSLNFRKYSIMRKELVAAKKHGKATVFYILENKKVIAWSILIENSFNVHRDKISKGIKTSFYDVHFYVRQTYRKIGLGSKLYVLNEKICRLNNKKIYKVVHDDISKKFFNSFTRR